VQTLAREGSPSVNLALLERCDEDAVRPARQEALQVGLAHRQQQPAQVIALKSEDVEGVELDLVIVRLCSASKSASPVSASTTASPSSTKCVCRILRAVSNSTESGQPSCGRRV
jgi:hypothetical protein